MITDQQIETDDGLPIDGELLSERDLIDEQDLMDLALPEGTDQEWLLGELWKDLRRGEHAQSIAAEAEMRRVIELNRSLEHRMVEGLGQLVARIPLSVYLHWTARYGEEFWRDRDSIDFLVNRAGGGQGNPGFLVETKGKPTVIVDGFREQVAPVPAGDAAPGPHGVKPAGVALAAAPAVRPVRGRRGRWAN